MNESTKQQYPIAPVLTHDKPLTQPCKPTIAVLYTFLKLIRELGKRDGTLCALKQPLHWHMQLKKSAALLLLHAALRCPAFELTVCTTVMNEVAYMPEWIEYYALQGATRIVIGNHRSTDSLGMLAKLYAGRVPAVEVHANNGEQTPWLNWCAKRHKRSQWILFADNDEFFWSPQHGTLAAYLATVPADVTQVFGFGVRFGVGSCAVRHKLRVSATRIEVLSWQPRGFHMPNETDELPFPLVIQAHTRRPPNPHLPGESVMLENIRRSGLVRACNATLMRALYGDAFSGENPCVGIESGKSFVRGCGGRFDIVRIVSPR